MLTGSDLLAKVKELGDAPKTDLAKGCGYIVTKNDGSEQVKFTQFYEALLEAKGLTFSTNGSLVSAKVAASCLTKLSSRAATCW